MANSETVMLLLDTIKETKGYSDPNHFAIGLLGAMVDENELLGHIKWMKENAK